MELTTDGCPLSRSSPAESPSCAKLTVERQAESNSDANSAWSRLKHTPACRTSRVLCYWTRIPTDAPPPTSRHNSPHDEEVFQLKELLSKSLRRRFMSRNISNFLASVSRAEQSEGKDSRSANDDSELLPEPAPVRSALRNVVGHPAARGGGIEMEDLPCPLPALDLQADAAWVLERTHGAHDLSIGGDDPQIIGGDRQPFEGEDAPVVRLRFECPRLREQSNRHPRFGMAFP